VYDANPVFIKTCPFFFLIDWLTHAAFHTCEPTVFTCTNGRCVPYHYRCDHHDDCGDGSDEAACQFRPCDAAAAFACNNGRCVSREYVCNGINNCYDNGTSDEQNCRESSCFCVGGVVMLLWLLLLCCCCCCCCCCCGCCCCCFWCWCCILTLLPGFTVLYMKPINSKTKKTHNTQNGSCQLKRVLLCDHAASGEDLSA